MICFFFVSRGCFDFDSPPVKDIFFPCVSNNPTASKAASRLYILIYWKVAVSSCFGIVAYNGNVGKWEVKLDAYLLDVKQVGGQFHTLII